MISYYKPDDWDQWSNKDRKDYNSLLAALPGKYIIPESVLANMSNRVLKAAESLYLQIQFDVAYEAEMGESL